jgi:hypothetical protein
MRRISHFLVAQFFGLGWKGEIERLIRDLQSKDGDT